MTRQVIFELEKQLEDAQSSKLRQMHKPQNSDDFPLMSMHDPDAVFATNSQDFVRQDDDTLILNREARHAVRSGAPGLMHADPRFQDISQEIEVRIVLTRSLTLKTTVNREL